MKDECYSVDSDELNRLLRLLLLYADQQKMEHSKLAFMINLLSVKMGEELGLQIKEVEEIENLQ